MTLLPTSEQRDLRDAVTGVLADDGQPEQTWKRLSAELGVVGLCIPEEYGGSGGRVSDLTVVTEAMGHRLHRSPYLATAVLSVQALLHGADEQARERFLPAIAAGGLRAALAGNGSPTTVPDVVVDGAGADVRLT